VSVQTHIAAGHTQITCITACTQTEHGPTGLHEAHKQFTKSHSEDVKSMTGIF